MRDNLRGHRRARRLLADISAAFWVDTGLPESIELQGALDPRKAVIDGLAHRFLVMGIAAMEARLAAVVARTELLNRYSALPKPEFTLRRTA